jgi:hypothetical protein
MSVPLPALLSWNYAPTVEQLAVAELLDAAASIPAHLCSAAEFVVTVFVQSIKQFVLSRSTAHRLDVAARAVRIKQEEVMTSSLYFNVTSYS